MKVQIILAATATLVVMWMFDEYVMTFNPTYFAVPATIIGSIAVAEAIKRLTIRQMAVIGAFLLFGMFLFGLFFFPARLAVNGLLFGFLFGTALLTAVGAALFFYRRFRRRAASMIRTR